MANPEHIEIVGQGTEAIRRWRVAHPGGRLNLSSADLTRANLTQAILPEANLTRADFDQAILRGPTSPRPSFLRPSSAIQI